MIEGRRIEGEAVVTIHGDPIDWQGSLAILPEFAGDERRACEHCQRFKSEVPAEIKADGWRVAADDVAEWLRRIRQFGDRIDVPVEVVEAKPCPGEARERRSR